MNDKMNLHDQIRAMKPQTHARSEAAALAERAAPAGVMVKPLVWQCVGWSSSDGVRGENDDTWESYAVSDELPYVIEWHGGENFLITPPVGPNFKASTLSSAKAAAQADYAARITAALEPDPTPALGWRAMQDKIDGLASDLESAVEVAFKRGAVDWVRLNYPKQYAVLAKIGEAK